MSVQSKVWSYLKGKGLPEKSIAAVMGNIESESGFDIKKIETGSGIGFGLCQWSFGRRTQLERYGTSLDHQLNFMWAELSGTGITQVGASFQWINKSGYIKHTVFMSGGASISALTAAMCFCWERPAKQYAHLDRRQKAAQKYYNQFTGSTGEYTPNSVEGGANSIQAMEIESTNYEVVKGSQKFGDYLFGRRCRITISDDSGQGFDVSQLHCKFSILKTMQMEPNLSEISIYNLSAQTENNIRMYGSRVTVEAGYEGSIFGLIFDGDIVQCIQEKENANTFKLTVIALDSDRPINLDIANFSVLKGQSHRDVVNSITNSAKNPISLGSISDKLKHTKLTRGKVLFGKSSDYLNQIAKSNGLKFYMDDGKVNLIDLKEPPKSEIVKLDSKSGLIGVPEQTDYGVSGQSLLNPQIKLNCLIHIDNKLIRDKRIQFSSSNTIPGSGANSTTVTGGQLSSGGYLIPYDGEFKVTSHFGARWGTHHNGIDLGMAIGTPIYASKAGKVLKAGVDSVGVNSGGGKVVRLTHPDGSATNYYHLSDWKVKTGDTVRQGQIIGLSGNTGRSTGPHLHFEIKEGGKFINPFPVINGSRGPTPPNTQSIEETQEYDALQGNQGLVRALDKDGIYRVIKLEYSGDTRGNDWYVNFETITQVGGMIPMIST